MSHEDLVIDNNTTINDINLSAINQGKVVEHNVEALALLVGAERLKFLEGKISKEFKELKERQDQVSSHNKLIKAINSAQNNGELNIANNEELKAKFARAQELGVDINLEKTSYTKDELERLNENIRITIDDLNVLNEMQLQTVNRLLTERYETYQIMRSIVKPLHEDKIAKARAAGGR